MYASWSLRVYHTPRGITAGVTDSIWVNICHALTSRKSLARWMCLVLVPDFKTNIYLFPSLLIFLGHPSLKIGRDVHGVYVRWHG